MGGTSRAGRGEWVSSRPRAERARQAADVLRQQITGGAFPGGTLPGERELGERLGASRNAVREALALLRAEGLITRRRGVGTTVVAAKHGHGLDRLAGLAEALTGHGTVANEVREIGRVPVPPPAVAARLGLAPGAGAVRVERLRRLEGEPLSLDTTYLPGDIGEGLLRRPDLGRELAERDLFGLIEEVAGQPLGRAEVQVHAVAAAPATAALLGVPAGAAIFAIDRLAHLADGRPVDSEAVHIRADRLTLRATLYRAPGPPGA
ncbi:GntR family transcriptional regulator [Actinomadura montaniterrae]|uniref:GntR family transcriptional regulator n=1 Tax=Actinomadura montaniterrae TaxID=1803903 RepID=A0A6L3VCV3_9ACTN|nr:GntR family transcriptional regulator [Actinomadura montaniterrae]KAB2359009.1 GntR family transcriptional regulator [Actinomadura montaniterrae]